MSNEMLLGQFISYLLYDLRHASILRAQGRFYDAVTKQIEAIGILYFVEPDYEESLKNWEKQYEAIPIIVQGIVGTDSHETKYLRYRKMLSLSKELYWEIHKDVWDKLHDMKYFEINKGRPTRKRDKFLAQT